MTTAEFNECVDLYSDNLYRFILKNMRDKEDARDVVQDSFEKMWKVVDTIAADKAKSYLFTTGYHTMIDKIRRDKKKGDFNEVNFNSLQHSEQYSDLHEVLNEALNRLPEIQRTVVLLRDYEGYSYEEIGQITGLNEAQVKVYIYRARVTLREYIGSMDNVI
jgi:RNA polymerase sigma factor (sigma-70 family)